MCRLNRDATAIQFSPNVGFTMEEGLSYLSQSADLARQVASEVITDSMTDMEKIRAFYAYITQNVTYDQRYYNDLANMPLHSRTAYGALHDHVAICGGYALAFQLLLQQADIPCCTISGTYNGENHMWCVIETDDGVLHFDPTADRGTDAQWWRYFGVTEDRLFGHTWTSMPPWCW